MRSRVPKVLHSVAGREMLLRVADAVEETNVQPLAVVVGPENSGMGSLLPDGVQLVLQSEQLGTGHALLQAQSHLEGQVEHVLVVNGDLPLISGSTLRKMMGHHTSSEAALTLLTCQVNDPEGLGRVLRDLRGRVTGIVEQAEATPEQLEIREICCGVYCFQGRWLWPALQALSPHESGEYYVTDLILQASGNGNIVETFTPECPDEALGVNDRADLARASAILYRRTRERLMSEGVTLIDPPSTFVDTTVNIGVDSVIYPNTTIRGSTRIGKSCQIGPQAIIVNGVMGDRCRVQASVVEESTLEDDVDVGPFSHLRSGAYLESTVHLGNYVEVKKSRLGRGTRVGHFSYLGDATLGADVNIGAGTVTCNYDGVKKNPTVIGDGAFIGCDSMLVAPLTIGRRAITGAGAVVTHDVPEDTLVVGMPARVMRGPADHPSTGDEQSN